MAKGPNKHIKKSSKVHRIFCCIFSLSLIGIGIYCGISLWHQHKYNKLKGAVTATPAPTQAIASPEPVILDIPIDFDALQESNDDAYAWIQIPGTLVDYPILQNAEETDYYLSHSFDRSSARCGAIYTRNDTPQDFSAPCTVLYGHNMKDDSMFGSLHDYENPDFFADPKNRTITVYTPNAIRTYSIIAATNYQDALLPALYDFSDPVQKEDFIESLRTANGNFDDSLFIADDSRLIVLSTCATGGRSHLRYLVVGVMTDEKIC